MRYITALFTVVVSVVFMPTVASSRLDNGGEMSRELAVGRYCHNGSGTDCSGGTVYETIYATSQEDGEVGTSDDALTLWAFCPPSDSGGGDPAEGCDVVPTGSDPSDVCATPPPERACDPPCIWHSEIEWSTGVVTDSGKESFAPPATNKAGDRIYVASDEGNSGRIYAFDNCGEQVWAFDPGSNNTKKGFYAPPVVHEPTTGNPIVFAISYGTSNQAHLHAIEDTGTGYRSGSQWGAGYPKAVKLSRVRYKPVLDTTCKEKFAKLPDSPETWNECSPDEPRIYLASDNTGKGILAYDVNPTDPDCVSRGGSGPCLIWCSGGGNVEGVDCQTGAGDAYRLGGVIVEDVHLRTDSSGNPIYGSILVSQLADGVVGTHLDECTDPECNWKPGQQDWGLSSLFITQTHRSMPTLSVNGRDPDHIVAALSSSVAHDQPSVNITSRGGSALEQVSRIVPRDVGATSGNASGAWSQLYPKAGDPGVGTSSYSWVVPNPVTGHLFYGGATDSGIHRVNPRTVDRTEYGVYEQPATVEWFPYKPPNQWRTAPQFSGGGRWMHIGSAEARFYNINPDGRKGVALSCFDTFDSEGGPCTPGTGIPCCDDMYDEDPQYVDTVQAELDCRDETGAAFACTDYKIDVEFNGTLLPPDDDVIDFATECPNTFCSSVVIILKMSLNSSTTLPNTNPAEAVVGEIVNEHLESGSYSGWNPAPASQVAVALLAPGDNELRLALFDTYGNEVSRRITVEGVP